MTSVLTRMVAGGLMTPTLIVAVAILVKGYVDPGDGFAAGIVAALGVLLQYVAFGRENVTSVLRVEHAPLVALTGLAVCVALFVVPLVAGGAPLEHWPPAGSSVAKAGTLELITAVLFDIGVFLLVVGAAVTIIDAAASPDTGEEEG